jgi:hypothetical protein
VIYADPPWRFEPYSPDHRNGSRRREPLSYEFPRRDQGARCEVDRDRGLCVVPVGDGSHAPALGAWGFAYKTCAVWNKDRIGTGYWFRNKHEILLVGTRGHVPAPAMGTQWPSLVEAPVGRHSQKPAILYEMIETYFPTLPKIELHARGVVVRCLGPRGACAGQAAFGDWRSP